jgi:Ca-activated chloride channel family protein
MRRLTFALLFLPVLFAAGWLRAAQQPARPRPGGNAPAAGPQAARAPDAGALAIVNRQGETVAFCPLQHTDVTAEIAGFVARVNVEQRFRNPSKEPVEAVYNFPLPEDAAVDDMTMVLGTRTIHGEIKRREEARAIYEAARAAGQSAALLDQERPNIFTQSVANLMPGEDVRIRISYVNLLKYGQGGYEFAFPMVVGPRYIGGGAPAPGVRGAPGLDRPAGENPGTRPVVTDADRITPPITPQGTRAGHDISMTVNVDAGLPIREIRSLLHPVTIARPGENRATVRLKDEATLPNKDFILRYTVAGDQIQSCVLANSPGGGKGYFTLILQPPAAPPQSEISPKEMVFVIDQTGSQRGWPIKKAKETMRHCIENLNPGDTFQLIGFNTELFPCFPKPVPVTPENLNKAWKFLEPIEGNGGTDILKSVDYALTLPDDPGRLRIVCYMTDGYVGNDMQIIDYIRQHRGRARMFPFGVGNSVNRFLIDGMAREGRGAAEYVTLDSPGNEAAARFYERISKPLLLDVQVEWNGLPVEDVYPKAIPDVFTTGPIILKGRFTKAAEGEITVRGLLRGKPWSQRVSVGFPTERKEGAALPTLWAREKIEDLQAQDWMGAQTGKANPRIKDEIVGLALDYRLMSQYTSFVAVEERVVNVGGRQRRIDVPVEMPEGVSYEGIFGEPQAGQAGASLTLMRAGAMGRGLAAGPPPGAGGFGGGFGALGGVAGRAAPGAAPRVQRSAGGTPRVTRALSQTAGGVVSRESLEERSRDKSLADLATEEGRKRLAAMKPEERRALLERVKVAAELRDLPAKLKQAGPGGTLNQPGMPEVEKGRVVIQVWVNGLPKEALAKLKALGFEVATTLRPDKLLLGTLPVDRLDRLVELEFVLRVEAPKFKA